MMYMMFQSHIYLLTLLCIVIFIFLLLFHWKKRLTWYWYAWFCEQTTFHSKEWRHLRKLFKDVISPFLVFEAGLFTEGYDSFTTNNFAKFTLSLRQMDTKNLKTLTWLSEKE